MKFDFCPAKFRPTRPGLRPPVARIAWKCCTSPPLGFHGRLSMIPSSAKTAPPTRFKLPKPWPPDSPLPDFSGSWAAINGTYCRVGKILSASRVRWSSPSFHAVRLQDLALATASTRFPASTPHLPRKSVRPFLPGNYRLGFMKTSRDTSLPTDFTGFDPPVT